LSLGAAAARIDPIFLRGLTQRATRRSNIATGQGYRRAG